MFLIRYFRYAFQFDQLFDRLEEKWHKLFIYFLMLAVIAAFPLNYLIIREQGFSIAFIAEDFKLQTPNWTLPETCQIAGNRFVCSTNDVYVLTHRGVDYVFNYQGGTYDTAKKQVLFLEDRIVYTNGDGAYMVGNDYQGFTDTLDFQTFNIASPEEKAELYQNFGFSIEQSFSRFIVLYSLLNNTLINILIQSLFILLMALILQLFRFGYSHFISYFAGVKLMIYLMTIPAILSLIIGFVQPAFAQVVFQLAIGVIAMVFMLKYGKKKFA